MNQSNADFKLRIKFGEHEFEATGPVDLVEKQFQSFRQLIAPQATEKLGAAPPFQKLVLLKGRTAFLRVATKPNDSVLLVLLAQKQFRNNDSVTGAEIMNGLRESGIRIPRGDHILSKHARDGYVTFTGAGRKRRYRLTDTGIERAQQTAQALLSLTR